MTLKDSTDNHQNIDEYSDMILEFISSLPEIMGGNDPHDSVYQQAHEAE